MGWKDVLKAHVEERLQEVGRHWVQGGQHSHREAERIRDTCAEMLTRGKMLRSCWTVDVWCALAKNSTPPTYVMDVGLALECIHASSLVIDDFPEFDDEEERRGAPCVHKREGGKAFGLVVAASLLATQVALLSQALLDAPQPWVKERIAQVAAMLSSSTHAAAVGQIMEAAQARLGKYADARIQTLKLKQIHALKTAALFTAAPVCGALLWHGVTQTQIAQAVVVGVNVGLMFQAWDDARDAASDPACINRLHTEGAPRLCGSWRRMVRQVTGAGRVWWTPFLASLMRKLHVEFARSVHEFESNAS